ncbi:MAG: hypothetical protein WC713_05510, partial [Candidatus Methylomirabilota bacterium]
MLRPRSLHGWHLACVFTLGVACSLFHLSLAYVGILESLRMRAVHLGFLLPLAFLLYPAWKRSSPSRFSLLDIGWFGLSVFCCAYVGIFEYERLVSRAI